MTRRVLDNALDKSSVARCVRFPTHQTSEKLTVSSSGLSLNYRPYRQQPIRAAGLIEAFQVQFVQVARCGGRPTIQTATPRHLTVRLRHSQPLRRLVCCSTATRPPTCLGKAAVECIGRVMARVTTMQGSIR